MNIAAYSPRKLQLLNQCSPRGSTRKRILFPSNSPQSNDLGLISELYSSDSETYSPAPASPPLSITPNKDESFPLRPVLKVSNNLIFDDNSPQKRSSKPSPKKTSFGKENMPQNLFSTKKSARKDFLENQIFDDKFITVLSKSPEKQEMLDQFEVKTSENLTTPKKNTLVCNNKAVRRSPRSASKTEVTIKPVSFYGNIAPILATNQTNRIGGVKCVFRPDSHQSRAKTKLVFEENRSKKRERSKSIDAMREAKRRKAVFTGVHHAIPRPVKHTSPPDEKTKVSIREKARNVTDLSRTPYVVKKEKKKEEGWEHTLRFTKPMRYDDSPYMGTKRRFFKSTIRESPDQFKLCLSPNSEGEASPVIYKKRKLLDTQKNYLDENSPEKLKINASDIRELIEDDNDKLQEKPDVDDILLRLEEEVDEEEKRKEAERQMLMNILEDSPIKAAAIDSLSNCTASLDLNDTGSSPVCSRFNLEGGGKIKNTPQRTSTFKITPSRMNNSGGKPKWRGLGQGQLQIDAGQKLFGAHQCRDCGMIYQVGEAEDEIQHKAFHNNLSTLRHLGWKNEVNVADYKAEGYIIMITSDSPNSWQQKALDVLALVDKQLGITSDASPVMHNHKVFLYISDKCVVGCIVASPVSRAYRMISSDNDVDICSEESYPVKCGISRMWTLYSHRRQGVATRLLDTVRRNFMYGGILTKEDVAFSIPTRDGKQFAAKYMDSTNFLVYTGY